MLTVLPLVVPGALVLTLGAVAAATTDSPGLASPYGQGAALSLAVGLLGFALNAYRREVKSGDAARAEVARLNTYIQEQVVPVVAASIEAVRENTHIIADIHAEQNVLRRSPAPRRIR